MSTKIDRTLHAKIVRIVSEMEEIMMEREEVVWGTWVALVSRLHLLMLGPGGTGKSLLSRLAVQHIEGARRFEKTVDETSDPTELYGPPNIKLMVEEGSTVRVTKGKMPEAHIAFLDEIFNANTPLLHSLHPILNERVFDNGGTDPMPIPLISMLCGTNKLNADADVAPFFDRIHLRYVVKPIQDRENAMNMVRQSVARQAESGRGTSTHLAGTQLTKITLDDLEQANRESLDLVVPEHVEEMFHDVRQALKEEKGVEFSDRRAADAMTAVMANAWLRGHDTVQTMDLDILSNMWWVVQDQINEVRSVLLEMVNPNEKLALDLLDSLDEIRKELDGAKSEQASGAIDDGTFRRLVMEKVRNVDNVLEDAKKTKATAEADGTDSRRLDDVIKRSTKMRVQIAAEVFGLSEEQQRAMVGS